jgi:organic radical activating enzyme
MNAIDTEKVSATLRRKGIDLDTKRVSITNFLGSDQEKDFTEPSNCNGFGRVRHFKFSTSTNWVNNPLPILPAAKALGLKPDSTIRAQVFQNSICNWRCWYCFVDFSLLKGDEKHSSLLTADELVELYLGESDPPSMIDLSGGQPDLTPEWVPWMMESLTRKGLHNKVYLWSDDNLSNDYLWKYLTDAQIETMLNYKLYSRVSCFKGIDEKSFSLNTKASSQLFKNQFELSQRLIETGFDLYGYITLTAETSTNFEMAVPKFLDLLQDKNETFPLRVVPLEVKMYHPLAPRMNSTFEDMINGQYQAITVWNKELEKRFTKEQLELPITEVPLKNL